MTDQTEQITRKEIAALEGVHLATVYRHSQREGFPKGTKASYKSHEFFNRAEILKWLKANPMRPAARKGGDV